MLTFKQAPVGPWSWSTRAAPPSDAADAGRSRTGRRRSRTGCTAATSAVSSLTATSTPPATCCSSSRGREPAFGREACGLPRSLAEKPSSSGDGVFTTTGIVPVRCDNWGSTKDLGSLSKRLEFRQTRRRLSIQIGLQRKLMSKKPKPASSHLPGILKNRAFRIQGHNLTHKNLVLPVLCRPSPTEKLRDKAS